MQVIIERSEEEIVLRFPANTDYEAMKQEIDRLRFLEIVSKSKATQEDIDELVTEAKNGMGERTRARLLNEPAFAYLAN